MKTWGAFISGGVVAWVKKAVVGLGFGVITYTGFQAVASQVASAANGAWSGLPADVYKIVALAGFVDAMGVWLGAITAAVAILSMKKFGLLTA